LYQGKKEGVANYCENNTYETKGRFRPLVRNGTDGLQLFKGHKKGLH